MEQERTPVRGRGIGHGRNPHYIPADPGHSKKRIPRDVPRAPASPESKKNI